MTKVWKVYCDGGSRGNPGPAASAFAIEEDGKIIVKSGKYLGIATNNVAEYSAAILALEWLAENKNNLPEQIEFVHDSQLIARQLSGVYKIKNPNLQKLALKAKTIERTLPTKIIYLSVLREENKTADFLVNEVLDEKK